MTITNTSTFLILMTPIYVFIIHKFLDHDSFSLGFLNLVPFILWLFLWFSSLAVKDFVGFLVFALAFFVTGIVGLWGLLLFLNIVEERSSKRRMEADRRYLSSLSPRERAREMESREQIARDVMAQIRHEQQLERDLEIIDRHFKRK